AFRDVTQKKITEQEIYKLNSELERRVIERTAELEAANRELETFSYSVSHDLRAPLRHMIGFSKILTEDFGPALPDEAQRLLQRIVDGTSRMGLLVDELLNLSRVGRLALSVRAVSLRSLVDEVIALLQPDCEDRTIEWKIGELPLTDCDPTL